MPPSPGSRSIPASDVPAFRGSHSSAPHNECQGGKTKRPPDEEAEDHERNPGWFSQLIELCNDWHSGLVNVNHIYMAKVISADCQGCPIGQPTKIRHRAEARSGPNRANRLAMLPPTNPQETSGMTAAPRHLARTGTRCHATVPRCAASSSGLGDAAARAWGR